MRAIRKMTSEKLAKAIFSAETGFSCTFGAGGETCKDGIKEYTAFRASLK